jgi:spore coat protein U-like protein
MKRTVTFLFAVVLVLATAPLFAQTASMNLGISATVNANCSITTLPVAFGVYDPIVANAVAGVGDKAATGSVTITCTKGNGVTVDLDLGSHASGAVRRMAGGPDFLTYELYKENAHTNVWGSGVPNSLATGGAPSKAARTFTVYGNLVGGQDVGAAAYSDTVLATVNY